MADINRNLVVNVLRTCPVMSRADLSRATGLSGPTVSSIVADLTSRGLVEDLGQGVSSGGRPPFLVRLNDSANYVIGLKLMDNAISLVITDLSATVTYAQVTELVGPSVTEPDQERRPAPHSDPRSIVDAICTAVETALSSSGVDVSRIIGVGVGINGPVDAANGVCRSSPTFRWKNVPLARPISERLGYPVVLENDANTLAAAEQWFGRGAGIDTFIAVAVGAGIGSGVVLNGQLYRGTDGAAGEFGHVQLSDTGPLCSCGKVGCVEAWASDRAILRDVRAAVAEGAPTSIGHTGHLCDLTITDVAVAAENGDELSRHVLARAGHYLGRGLAMLMTVINPRLVIISGEGVQAGHWRFDPMREAIESTIFPELNAEIIFATEPLDDARWARGAACVVLGEIFNTPTQPSLVPAKLG
ncbi:MAG: ROK family transcriptional regulator [Acidimicrobiales bacterium]|jgi:predicted NBD/HSP70 family sugar kinase